MHHSSLIIFVKNPELGKVKTRLANTMGDQAALDIYQKLLTHTCNITTHLPFNKVVYYSEHIESQDLWTGGFEKKLQSNGDLGQKMSLALTEEFKTHEKVCIIGSDCAELTSDTLTEAFKQLDQYDAVIGPANDGGYYLLGIKTMHASLFTEMPWSTDQVLQETIERLKKENLTHYLLPELIDVDTEEDWEKVKKNIH